MSQFEEKNSLDQIYLPWKQADFYEALAEAQSDLGEGVIIIEGHGRRVVYANGAFCKMFGYRKEEVLKLDSIYSLVPPEHQQELLVRNQLRMSGAQVTDHYEAVGVKKDGMPIHLEVSAKAIEGTETYSVVLLRDITERKKREHTFGEAYKVIEDLYNRAPCGYHSVDKNGVYLYVNDTLLSWLGYTREEMIGKLSIFDVVPKEYQEQAHRFFSELVKSCVSRDMEFELLKKDRQKLPVLVKATAATDDQGRFVMSRTMTIDMTAQRKITGEIKNFQESQKRLFAAFKEMQGALEGFSSF